MDAQWFVPVGAQGTWSAHEEEDEEEMEEADKEDFGLLSSHQSWGGDLATDTDSGPLGWYLVGWLALDLPWLVMPPPLGFGGLNIKCKKQIELRKWRGGVGV